MKQTEIWNKIKCYLVKTVYAVAVLSAAFGWWGVLYPQLTLTKETYRIVSEGENATTVESREWSFDDTIYEEILNADSSRIRFRSRLLMELSQYFKSLQD